MVPSPRLRPFVELLWCSENDHTGSERVLPTGRTHIVFRLEGPPVFGAYAVVGGPRDRYYDKDVAPSRSVGALLWPGAVEWLLGVPASELAHAHTDLAAIWPDAPLLREQLCAAQDPLARLDQLLLARALKRRGIHPHISHALQAFRADTPVADVVDDLGCSHRHFIRQFEHAVGLTPKTFCRVQRFQKALAHPGPIIDTAYAAGFSDQAHFTREFQRIAGLTPGAYQALAPARANHVTSSAQSLTRK